MNTKTEITSNAIYKIVGQPCWYVPSDSQPNTMYKVCFAGSDWRCTCAAGERAANRGQSATCKHSRAAQVAVLANKVAPHPQPRMVASAALATTEPERQMRADKLTREQYVREFAIYG